MFNFTYNMFCMGRMLKDKAIGSLSDYYNGEYSNVKRMEPSNSGIVTNFNKLNTDPTHIIDNIYLGNAYNASNYSLMEERNIGLVVNITTEIPNYFPDNLEYYNIHIRDLNGKRIGEFFDDYLNKIEEYKKSNDNKSIFIHCFMGSSRSATLACLYLIKYHNMTVEESIKFCKDKRSLININLTFIEDLKTWYKNNITCNN